MTAGYILYQSFYLLRETIDILLGKQFSIEHTTLVFEECNHKIEDSCM